MEDPVHVTLNVSASAMSPCVNTSSGPNRLCACEAVPVFSTGFSEDLSEQLQCLGKGGEIDTQHKSTARNACKSKNQSISSGGVISKETIKSTISDCLSLMTGRDESQQLDPIQIQGTITKGTRITLRTKRGRQQKAPNRINDGEGDLFCVTTQGRDTDNELIRQLRTKIKEKEHSINELSSAVELFLKIQLIVKKLQGNILKILKQAVAKRSKSLLQTLIRK
jgi:hypothetical protein